MAPIRITYLLTHPVQYFSPWFRHIAANAPEVELTVLYVTVPTNDQRGVGFGRAIDWGTPLLDGYPYQVVRAARDRDSVATGRFWGLGMPDVTAALVATRPDAVVVPGWQSAAYVRALVACRLRGIPTLYRGDTHLGSAPAGVRRRLWSAKNRLALQLFDAYLAVGTRSREFLLAHGADPDRIVSSPHAVDGELFARQPMANGQQAAARVGARRSLGLAEHAFVAMFVGKLDPVKRPLDLIAAAAKCGGVDVLMVGAGPMEHECRESVRRAGVPTVFAGFVDQPSLPRLFAAADCLVLPSESETWGLVVNEALSAGVPCVVSSSVGCAPDLITSGLVGQVFPVGDVDALANAITDVRQRASEQPDLVAHACREAAAGCSYDNATDGLIEAAGIVSRSVGEPTALIGSGHRVLVCGAGMVVIGGCERMIFEVMRVCLDRGAAVHVLVNDWGASRIVNAAESIGATWSYSWLRAPLRRNRLTPLGVAAYAWEFARSSSDLLRAAAGFRPTCVLVPDYGAALRNSFGLLILRWSGTPVVLTLHNAPEPGSFYRRLWRWLVNPLVSKYVCNSGFTERELLACGIARDKVLTVLNTTATRPPARGATSTRTDGRVVYVGQIIPEKGVDYLLDAMELLLARGVEVSLDIIGDMDGWAPPDHVAFRDGLRRRAAGPPLAGRVRLLGYRDDVAECLQSASVHCCPSLPSNREAFGLVVLEAKQAGIPSVVFPSGALPELVTHRVDGWVCAEATAASLADGLAFFVQNHDERCAAGHRAEASAARFSRRKFSDVWWRVISGQRPAAAPGMIGAETR